MNYTQIIKLDITPNGDMPVVRIKQGDASARFIKMLLMNGSDVWAPENGVSFKFRCEKPDRSSVIIESGVVDETLERVLLTVSGNEVTLELISQISMVAGKCRCDICMEIDDQIISTMPFIIDVIGSPTLQDDITYVRPDSGDGQGGAGIPVGQCIIGQYNVPDPQNQYLFIVGNGASDTYRSNAFAMKWDGTFVFANGTQITPAQFRSLMDMLANHVEWPIPVVTEYNDSNGATVLDVSTLDLSQDTVSPSVLMSGYTAHDSTDRAITGTA